MEIIKTYIPKKYRSEKLNGGNISAISIQQQISQQDTPPSVIEHSQLKSVRSILDENLPDNARDIHLSKEAADNLRKLAEGLFLLSKNDTVTAPADDNVFSALRTLFEIANNNEELKKIFLRKDLEDTAKEKITFDKGFVSNLVSKFLQGYEVGNFTAGMLGGGGAFKMVDGKSELEVDKLTVRMIATFFELVISKLRHVGGQIILSPAQMKCTKVVDGGSYYRCYFDAGTNNEVANEFVSGDQARCQIFSGSGAKMYWRLVTSVGADWINLSKTDQYGDGIPAVGDDIVQLGNRDNPERQNAQILSTVGSDAPSYKQYAGINSFSLEGKELNVLSSKGNKFVGVTEFLAGSTGLENIPAFVETKDKIDNLKVGGRNLVRGVLKFDASDYTEVTIDNNNNIITSTGKWNAYGWLKLTINERLGKQYIVGLDVMAETNSVVKLQILADYPNCLGSETYSLTANQWQRITVTSPVVEAVNNNSNNYFMIVLNGDSAIKLHFKPNFKVEDGNIATAQSEAPEDIQERISAERDYVNAIKSDLQSQIDGNISSFFYDYEPELSNIPASSWSSDSVREIHLGDLFYWTSKGWAYRFQKVGGVFSWTRISDTDVTKALADAARAQDTADGKRTTFVTQPVPPYERGDLWAQGSGGELMRCITARTSGAFAASDWEKASKYTDDTAVNNLQIGGINKTSDSHLENINGYEGSIRQMQLNYPVTEWETDKAIRFKFSGGSSIIKGYTSFFPPAVGEVYSLSVYAKNLGSSPVILYSNQGAKTDVLLPGQAKRIKFENIVGDGYGYLQIQLRTQNVGENIDVALFHVQLEEGSKVTTYSENPEIVKQRIADAKQAGVNAQNAVNATNQNVSSLNTYVDGAFKDGMISQEEAKRIADFKKDVEKTKSDAEAAYNKVYLSAYLDGVPKTDLLNAKINYFGAIDTLMQSILTAIADGATTPAEKADVDAKREAYRNASATFESALNAANDATKTKLKEISIDALSGSLVPGLEFWNGSTMATITDGKEGDKVMRMSLPLWPNEGIYIPVDLSKKYKVRFWARAAAGTNGLLYFSLRQFKDKGVMPCASNGGRDPYHPAGLSAHTDWVLYEHIWQAADWQSEVKFVLPEFLGNYDGTAGYWDIQGFKMYEVTEAENARLAASAAQQAADNAKATLTSFQTEVNTTFRDGILNTAEKESLKKYLNPLEERRLEIISSFVQLYVNNTYLQGTTAITNLGDAKDALVGNTGYGGKLKELVDVINGVVNGYDVVTPAEKQQVDNAFRLYSTALAVYSTRVEEAQKAIQDKLKGYSDAAQATANEAKSKATAVEATANKSKAITDKFGTTVEGGLIQSVMMLLRELNSQAETAGISGIQGDGNKPSFWSGGTYAQALAFKTLLDAIEAKKTNPNVTLPDFNQIAKIVLAHNAFSKMGEFIIEPNGTIKTIDHVTGIAKLLINSLPLPLVTDLISASNQYNGESTSNAIECSGVQNQIIDIGNQINILKDNTELSISGNFSASVYRLDYNKGTYVYLKVNLLRNGDYYNTIGVLHLEFPSDPSLFAMNVNGSGSVSFSGSVPGGTYTLQLIVQFDTATIAQPDGLDFTGQMSAIRSVWKFANNMDRMQIGLDGYMLYYPEGHFHYSKSKGLDVRGAMNIPGVLCAGRVNRYGNIITAWGAKKNETGMNAARAEKVSGTNGVYKVYHSIGHTDYIVTLTLNQAERLIARVTNYQPTYFIAELNYPAGNIGDTYNADFSYMCVGDNY